MIRRFIAALAGVTLSACAQGPSAPQGGTSVTQLQPAQTGYADAAEGLQVYYEIYGEGEPIVVIGGGQQDAAGYDGAPARFSRARLAIVPGYTHYNFGQGPDIARVIEGYLDNPTSTATQFAPEAAQ